MNEKKSEDQIKRDNLAAENRALVERQYGWALKEDVRVTLIRDDPHGTMVLVERLGMHLARPSALVLSFDDRGFGMINGRFVDLGDDLPCWCGLADSVFLAPDVQPGDDVITRSIDAD